MQKQYFCVLAAMLFFACLQEEKQSLQKNALSDEAALTVPCVKMNRKPSQ